MVPYSRIINYISHKLIMRTCSLHGMKQTMLCSSSTSVISTSIESEIPEVEISEADISSNCYGIKHKLINNDLDSSSTSIIDTTRLVDTDVGDVNDEHTSVSTDTEAEITSNYYVIKKKLINNYKLIIYIHYHKLIYYLLKF
eukprot:23458_1